MLALQLSVPGGGDEPSRGGRKNMREKEAVQQTQSAWISRGRKGERRSWHTEREVDVCSLRGP